MNDILVGILRDADDPLGTQLSRRGKRSLAQLGLVAGNPTPVRPIVEAHGLQLDQLEHDLAAQAPRGTGGDASRIRRLRSTGLPFGVRRDVRVDA